MNAFREMGTNAIPFLREKLVSSFGQRFQRPGDNPRSKAAWILSHLGPHTATALPDLIAALEDDDFVAIYAADALGKIGSPAKPAVPALFDALRFGNGRAAPALANIDPNNPELVPALIDVLKNANPQGLGQPRVNAAMALGRLGKKAAAAIPALRQALTERDMQHFAAQALRRIAPGQAEVMAEVDAAMQQHRPPPLPPIAELIDQSKSGDMHQRRLALQNLGSAVAMARFKGAQLPQEQIQNQILPLLSEALDDSDPNIAQAAAYACSGIGKDAQPLLPKLLALARTDSPARNNVLGSLLHIAPGDKRALPLLFDALDDWSPGTRGNAAAQLREYGPEAREAVPGLQKLLKDSEPWVRLNASIALWNIARQPPSIAVFIERLQEEENDDFVSLTFCKVFGEMGPGAKEAVPTLRDFLTHWSPKVREQARAALQKVGPNDPALNPKSEKAILAPDVQPTQKSLSAQSSNSPTIPAALGPTIRKLRTRDPETRLDALEELGRKGVEAREALPFLLPLLKHEDAETRAYVAAMLADVDPKGSEVVQHLRAALNDSDEEVRANATLSLERIDKAK